MQWISSPLTDTSQGSWVHNGVHIQLCSLSVTIRAIPCYLCSVLIPFLWLSLNLLSKKSVLLKTALHPDTNHFTLERLQRANDGTSTPPATRSISLWPLLVSFLPPFTLSFFSTYPSLSNCWRMCLMSPPDAIAECPGLTERLSFPPYNFLNIPTPMFCRK